MRQSATLVASVCALGAASAAQAAPGDLDQSFSGDGRVTTAFTASGEDIASAVAIQADGKIVVAGAERQDFALARYNPDGSLDSTFDGDGKVTTNFGGNDNASGVAIQPDGKIVVAGTSNGNPAGGTYDIALARYNTEGGLDMGFGGTGMLFTNISRVGSPAMDGDDVGTDVALQPDGKIVVAATDSTNRDFAIVRYQTNGDLDASFDDDGRQVTNFGTVFESTQRMAIQPDLRLVVVGAAGGPTDLKFAVARYLDDGTPDPSFSGDGRRTTDFGARDFGTDVAIQPDGRIVVGGTSQPGSESHFAVARHDPDGGLDGSFSGDGMQTIDFGGPSTSDGGLVLQPDGKIVQVGQLGGDFAIARLTPEGELDGSFSGDGRQTTEFGGADYSRDSALQADGKIVVVGLTNEAGDNDFAVARYLGGNPEVPAGGGPGGGLPPPPGETALGYLGRSLVRVSRTGRFALVVQGPPGQAASIGLRSVRTFRGSVAAQRRARPLTLGSKRFSFAANGRATVRFRLSRRNLRVLRRVKRLRTRATATAGAQRTAFTFTLGAPRKR